MLISTFQGFIQDIKNTKMFTYIILHYSTLNSTSKSNIVFVTMSSVALALVLVILLGQFFTGKIQFSKVRLTKSFECGCLLYNQKNSSLNHQLRQGIFGFGL